MLNPDRAIRTIDYLFSIDLKQTCEEKEKSIEAEVESRTQGSRPRTQKKSEAKDSLSEDRHSRGQGQECSRPRTQAQVLSKKKKRSSQTFFRRSPKKKKKKRSSQKFFKRSRKNVFQKIFQALHKILTIQKIVSSSRGQANFRGLEVSRPRTSKSVLEAKDVLEDSTSVLKKKSLLLLQSFFAVMRIRLI